MLGVLLAIGVAAGTGDGWNEHTNPWFFILSTFPQKNRRDEVGREGRSTDETRIRFVYKHDHLLP